jgi:hypothetical protein
MMKLVADDVEGLVIPDCGHWVTEEAPEELPAALTTFLAPYRGRLGGSARRGACRRSGLLVSFVDLFQPAHIPERRATHVCHH